MFDVKLVEVFLLISFAVLMVHYVNYKPNIKLDKQSVRYIKGFSLFIFCALFLSLLSLRLPTFPVAESLLKQAPYLSLSRLMQITLNFFAFITVYRLLVSSRANANLFINSYILFGLFNALYGIVSYHALMVGLDLGGAYDVSGPRAKGLFFEGGPFGAYLISVLLLILFRKYYLNTASQPKTCFQAAIVLLAVLLAQSKVAILLGLLLLSVYYFRKTSILRLGGVALLSSVILGSLSFTDGIYGYIDGVSNFDLLIESRADDTAFAMGRIMGFILVPRIIIEYPFSGIGIGNYSLQRNNPDLLQGLPTTEYWDLPGLGFFGDVAELGIPLALVLIMLISNPLRSGLKYKMHRWIIVLSTFHIAYYLLGGQITFTYPWFMSAIALVFMESKANKNAGVQSDYNRRPLD